MPVLEVCLNICRGWTVPWRNKRYLYCFWMHSTQKFWLTIHSSLHHETVCQWILIDVFQSNALGCCIPGIQYAQYTLVLLSLRLAPSRLVCVMRSAWRGIDGLVVRCGWSLHVIPVALPGLCMGWLEGRRKTGYWGCFAVVMPSFPWERAMGCLRLLHRLLRSCALSWLFFSLRVAPSGPPSSLLSTSISATAIAAEKRPCMSSVLVA